MRCTIGGVGTAQLYLPHIAGIRTLPELSSTALSVESYYRNSRPEVCELVPLGSGRVLDVGCGAGGLGGTLLDEGRADHVDGIEVFADAAELARTVLDEVAELDLEDAEALAAFASDRAGRYDVVVLADVVEHVREPEDVVAALLASLAPNGLVVASIPNIRSTGVLVPLVLRGRFDYRDRGVLDRTHLRFFTRRTAVELLEGAGLEVTNIERSVPWWRTGVRRMIGRAIGDFGTEQFLITARRGT